MYTTGSIKASMYHALFNFKFFPTKSCRQRQRIEKLYRAYSIGRTHYLEGCSVRALKNQGQQNGCGVRSFDVDLKFSTCKVRAKGVCADPASWLRLLQT